MCSRHAAYTHMCMSIFDQLQNFNIKIAFIERRLCTAQNEPNGRRVTQ